MIDFTKPHRRLNPLTGEWILVSPQRAQRPWQGTIEAPQKVEAPEYVAECHLCPTNPRSNGEQNPQYPHTFVFTNDHSALLLDAQGDVYDLEGLIHAKQERGVCRVICYTPQHNKTMAELSTEQITEIVKTWKSEYLTIGALDQINYVQIFENKGPLMGASSPHPHGQIWANEDLPTIIEREQGNQKEYYDSHATQLLREYLTIELKEQTRVIAENEAFAVVIPFWATWPYETLVLPKRHVRSFQDMTEEELPLLSNILKRLTVRYDKIFTTSFPYSMGIHQKPTDTQEHPEWQFHMHFYPPLLRSATIKKYFVGYEMMAEAQRDINPETAAKTLREVHE